MNKFEEMYLDWINNFLTIEGFSEYYSLTAEQAKYVIYAGKKYHEEFINGGK